MLMQTHSQNSQKKVKGDDRIGVGGRQASTAIEVKGSMHVYQGCSCGKQGSLIPTKYSNEDIDVQAKAATRKFEETSPATYHTIRCLRTIF